MHKTYLAARIEIYKPLNKVIRLSTKAILVGWWFRRFIALTFPVCVVFSLFYSLVCRDSVLPLQVIRLKSSFVLLLATA